MTRHDTDPEVLVVAGEASGDRHGAGLVRAVRALDPGLRFSGVGGREMAEAGVTLYQDVARLGVVGLVEVLGCLPVLWRTYRTLKHALHERRPALCLLIDYPDFNLLLARQARRAGVPVLYFVSPQLWAWRRGRIRTIADRVDRMLVLFPFEVDLYREAGVPVEFVGHPLADEVIPPRNRDACRSRLGLVSKGPVVGLLPGSRRSEVARHLAPMLEAAELLGRSHPSVRFVLPVARTLDADDLRERVAARDVRNVLVADGSFDDAVGACDVAAVASGTATLEVGLREIPLVVVYRTSALTHAVARRVVHLPHVGLVNLVAGRQVAPELIQQDFTPERLAATLDHLLRHEESRSRTIADLGEVRRRLRGGGAYARAAEILRDMVRGEGSRTSVLGLERGRAT